MTGWVEVKGCRCRWWLKKVFVIIAPFPPNKIARSRRIIVAELLRSYPLNNRESYKRKKSETPNRMAKRFPLMADHLTGKWIFSYKIQLVRGRRENVSASDRFGGVAWPIISDDCLANQQQLNVATKQKRELKARPGKSGRRMSKVEYNTRSSYPY